MATKKKKKKHAAGTPSTKRKRKPSPSTKRKRSGSTKPGHGFKFVVERIKLDRRGYDARGRHYAREPGMKLFQVKVIDKATDIYQDALVQARTMSEAKADVMASMMRSLSGKALGEAARAHKRARAHAPDPDPYMHADSRGLQYAPPVHAIAQRMPPRPRARIDVERIRVDSGGYDAHGRYWGAGLPLWRVSSTDGAIEEIVRAESRDEARARVLRDELH